MLKKLVILAGFVVVVLGAFFVYDINAPASVNEKDVNFSIARGQTTVQIAENLKSAGLLRNSYTFRAYTRLQGAVRGLQAGDYVLSTSMTPVQIFEALSGGKVAKSDLVVRIVEGATITDIADTWATLHSDNGKARQEFLAAVDAQAKTYAFFGEQPKVKSLEGHLFPDTYFLAKNADPDALIKKMLATLDVKLSAELRAKIKARNKTIYEILIMASLVEKEVGRNVKVVTAQDLEKLTEERKIVAGIFYNRLGISMALQSDATVTYITKKKDPSASAEDLKIDSPYNTYKYRGLPPGPISNPSLSSIIAAIEPTSSDYLYFLTKPDGTAVFAKTFEEHVANKNKYLK